MPQFNDPTTELSYLEKDDVLLSGSPSEYANIKAQNLFNRDITRSALMTLIQTNKLLKGQHYVISNAVSNTMSLMVIAVDVDTLDEIARDTTNGNNVSYDIDTDVATAIQQTQINGTGFVKASGTTISYDNSTYLTSISGINAGGELSGNYPNPNLVNSAVTGKVLTGLSVTGSAIVSTDSMLTAFGKLQNQLNALVGGVNYRGTWNASTNTPSLASGVGTQGYYYVVSVAGSTNLDGITDWQLGDWAIFNGTAWQKVDNTDAVVSVNGYTGIVTLSAADVGALPTSAISGTTGKLAKFTSSGAVGDSIVSETADGIAIDMSTNYYGNFAIKSNSSTSYFGINVFASGNGNFIALNHTGSEGIIETENLAGTQTNIVIRNNGTERIKFKTNGTIITNSATDTGEHFIVGGSARVNGNTSIYGTARNLLLTGSSAYTEFALYNTTANANSRNWSIATNAYNAGDLNFIVSTAQGGNPISGNYAITFTKEGNVGIGSTSPTSFGGYSTIAVNGSTGGIFETQSNGTSAMLMFSNDVASLIREQRNLPLVFGTNNTERMRIDASGNVLIGTTTDASGYKLQVAGLQQMKGANTLLNFGELDTNNTYFQALNLAQNASKGIAFFGTTEYGRFASSGNFLIGTTTDNGADKLQVNGSGYFGGNVQIFGANQALVMASSTTTLYTTYRANSVDVGYIGNGTGTIGSGATDFGIRAENNLIFAILNVEKMRIKSNTINISSLPTSASGLSTGDVWNDGGTLKIV